VTVAAQISLSGAQKVTGRVRITGLRLSSPAVALSGDAEEYHLASSSKCIDLNNDKPEI
jgi:hypothetical protein